VEGGSSPNLGGAHAAVAVGVGLRQLPRLPRLLDRLPQLRQDHAALVGVVPQIVVPAAGDTALVSLRRSWVVSCKTKHDKAEHLCHTMMRSPALT